MKHDLDQLCVVVPGELDCANVVFAHVAALAHHFRSEPDSGVRLRVIRCAAAVSRDLGIIELGEVLAEVRVR